jgi:hypothetical protein
LASIPALGSVWTGIDGYRHRTRPLHTRTATPYRKITQPSNRRPSPPSNEGTERCSALAAALVVLDASLPGVSAHNLRGQSSHVRAPGSKPISARVMLSSRVVGRVRAITNSLLSHLNIFSPSIDGGVQSRRSAGPLLPAEQDLRSPRAGGRSAPNCDRHLTFLRSQNCQNGPSDRLRSELHASY